MNGFWIYFGKLFHVLTAWDRGLSLWLRGHLAHKTRLSSLSNVSAKYPMKHWRCEHAVWEQFSFFCVFVAKFNCDVWAQSVCIWVFEWVVIFWSWTMEITLFLCERLWNKQRSERGVVKCGKVYCLVWLHNCFRRKCEERSSHHSHSHSNLSQNFMHLCCWCEIRCEMNSQT